MPIRNIPNATIEEITRERGNTFVTVRYMNAMGSSRSEQTIRLVVGSQTIIVNRLGGTVPVSELRVGMMINATVSSAMTRSIPPQATAYLIRIIRNAEMLPQPELPMGPPMRPPRPPMPPQPEPPMEPPMRPPGQPRPPQQEPPMRPPGSPRPPQPEPPMRPPGMPTQPGQPEEVTVGRILDVDQNNRSFTTISDGNFSTVIRFNVADNAWILDRSGREISFDRLSAGMRVRVRHANFMTASIPPQTTAFEVRVL